MPRSPLTLAIQRAQSLVDQINALPQEERDLFLDLLLPEPEPEKVKKTRKKRQAKAEKRGLPQQTDAAATVAQKVEHCYVCHEEREHSNHDSTYLSSHPFQSAPSAKKRSPAKSAANNSIPNSETPTDGVSSAALAASGD